MIFGQIFPGGWRKDKINAFPSDGPKAEETNMQRFSGKFLIIEKDQK